MRPVLRAILAAFLVSSAAAHARQAPPAVIVGSVVDARDGTPLEGVAVRVDGSAVEATTGRDGRFRVEGIAAGPIGLYVSLIGYGLARRQIDLAAGQVVAVTIPLSEGTSTYTEQVTVQSESEPADHLRTSRVVLTSVELQQLRGTVLDDPLRAVQNLPGVSQTDDFYTGFTVRGSDFHHIGVSFDGVPARALVHTLQGVEDGGSIAMINTDILDQVTLNRAGYAQQFGNRTGAQLDFTGREGSRDRFGVRLSMSGTSAAVVTEGPLGRNRRGSWLASARQSYLDLLVRRILDDEVSFVFSFRDAYGRLVYDVSPRHQLQFSTLAGRSRFKDRAPELGRNTARDAYNVGWLTNLGWRYTPSSRLIVMQRLYAWGGDFRSSNTIGTVLDRGRELDIAYRTDVTFEPAAAVRVAAGGEVQRLAEERGRLRYDSGVRAYTLRQDYDASAHAVAAYGSARFTIGGLSLSPGARVDWWGLTDAALVSPWGQIAWHVPLVGAFAAAGGIYIQYPDFVHVEGTLGRRSARPERARHLDVSFQRPLSDDVSMQVVAYVRGERDRLHIPDTEFRMLGELVVAPSADGRYLNTLHGWSKGVEVLIQRRAQTGLSGWVAYSVGRTQFVDSMKREGFFGDYDQRHALTLYGRYRVSDRTSTSARFRTASNVPVRGYIEAFEDAHRLAPLRNTARVPLYGRLDVRADRVFRWGTRRVTAYAELNNVLGRRNLRQTNGTVDPRTGRVDFLLEKLMPRVPSVGVLVEF